MSILLVLLATLTVSQIKAEVVDLSCSDNATCIQNLPRELARSIRQQKTVRLFDFLTIEPTNNERQGRANEGALARFLNNHALSFDWNDYSFRFTKPTTRSGVIEMDVFEGRAVEEAEAEPTVTKKGTKTEEESEEVKPKRRIIRRRHSKRIMQALLPMILGMKSASTVILAIAAVAALTIKAFIASKLALAVTVGMAAKRLYESFGQGVGLHNPYLYSQYPIDFPSASSQAYSVSGVSNPHFAAPELYGPSALAAHSHQHEMLQQSDASAQQSQSAPTLQLANATQASERWDGKSKLLGYVHAIMDKVKGVLQPLAGKIIDVMPVSFRGITSKAFGLEKKPEVDELEDFIESRIPKGVKVDAIQYYLPKQILVPKPRSLSEKLPKMTHKIAPKKVMNKTMDLNKLKDNKDLNDYIKTKKYNYNFANTHYYPKIKYFINQTTTSQKTLISEFMFNEVLSTTADPNYSTKIVNKQVEPDSNKISTEKSSSRRYRNFFFRRFARSADNQYLQNNEIYSRQKRSVLKNLNSSQNIDRTQVITNQFTKINESITEVSLNTKENQIARGLSDLLFNTDPVGELLKQVDDYVKSHKKKPEEMPIVSTSQKLYYVGVEMVTFSLQLLDVYVNMHDSIINHLTGDDKHKKKHKKTNKHKSSQGFKKNMNRINGYKAYNKQLNKKVMKG